MSKFLLITFVYLFLVVSTFSQYSNLRKIEYDQDAYGYNTHFTDTSPKRIVLNKKNRSVFTSFELEQISKLDNIDYINENDILIDTDFGMNADDIYFYGSIKDASEIDDLDFGNKPTNDNEIVIEASSYDYYVSTYGESLIGKKLVFSDDIGNMINDKFTITGIKYSDEANIFTMDKVKFYFTANITKRISNLSSIRYSHISLIVNNKVAGDDYYYSVATNANLKKGETYAPNSILSLCSDFDCDNDNISLEVSDAYHTVSVPIKVKDIITNENINKLVNSKDYDRYAYTIFISEDDYNELFIHDAYQISVYMKDDLKSKETIKKLNDMGYKTIYVKELLVNELETVMGVLQIFRSIVFIIASIALFFISYFIIKLILKSRNIYYSTIRILGASRAQASSILRIELLFDLNLAFFLFIAFILLAKFNVINSSYVSDIINYFGIIDYIIIYVILNVMSLLISNRYANKLFKTSVMNAYREEV